MENGHGQFGFKTGLPIRKNITKAWAKTLLALPMKS
jgi:hypothetical protein